MSAKYSALLEACNTIQLTGKLGILEEGSVDEATSIKLQLVLQENVNFIKQQLFRTPLVENIQANLGARWTQAILEDIDIGGNTQTDFSKNIGAMKDDLVKFGGKLSNMGSSALDSIKASLPVSAGTYNTLNSEHADLTNKYSNLQGSKEALANEHADLVNKYSNLQGSKEALANDHAALQRNYNVMQGSQQALANDHAALAQQASGTGAKAGIALDNSFDKNPLATSAALGSAAGLAGYGGYKLGQKVFRRR